MPGGCGWPVTGTEQSFESVLLGRSDSAGTSFQLQQRGLETESCRQAEADRSGEGEAPVCWSQRQRVRFPGGCRSRGAVWAGGLKDSRRAAIACEEVDVPNYFLHLLTREKGFALGFKVT